MAVNTRIASGLAIALALISLTGFALYNLTSIGCPEYRYDLKAYEANKPDLPAAKIGEEQVDEIAKRLVTQWLENYRSGLVAASAKLDGYEVERINVHRNEGELVAAATFSVKPARCSYETWAVDTNGVEDGAWIRSMFLFFTIVKDGDRYQVKSVGTGP